MAHGQYAQPPLSNQKSRRLLLILGVIIAVAVGIVTYNRIKMEREVAAQQAAGTPKAPDRTQFKKQGELEFVTAEGKLISRIDIEIADNDESRERGLMYRDQMGADQGMLFVFPNEIVRTFWMKNTILTLDLIFVNRENRIVTVLHDTSPFDESTYASTEPASYVIEVNAGYAKKHDIVVGDRMKWKRL